MRTIAALCVQAVLAPQATAQAPLTAAELRAEWWGGLRHVQLLEVRAGEPAVAVLATAFESRSSMRPEGESCLALYELPFWEAADARNSAEIQLIASQLELAAPVATLRVTGHLLPTITWWSGPTWRVVRFGDEHIAVMHDEARRRLVVQRFLMPAPSLVVEGCAALWDVALDGTELRVLLARHGDLALLRYDLASQRAPCPVRALCEDDGTAAATFVVGAPGAMIVTRATEGGLVFTELSVERREQSTTVVAAKHIRSSGELRLAARRSGATVAVLVGPLRSARGWRRVVLVPELGLMARAHDLNPMGWAPDRTWDDMYGERYGHALALLPDLDEDGVLEALITDSEGAVSERVELLSGATATLSDVERNGGFRFGSSLSVTADGRSAVAAGGRSGMPELLNQPAEAVLMRIDRGRTPALVRVARWSCQLDGTHRR